MKRRLLSMAEQNTVEPDSGAQLGRPATSHMKAFKDLQRDAFKFNIKHFMANSVEHSMKNFK